MVANKERLNIWTRGLVAAGFALVLALVMALHDSVPNATGNLGSLIDTFLPWFGWLVLPLGLWAGLRRSASAGAALLVPILVWTGMYAGLLPDKSDGSSELTVVTHNVSADNADPAATVASLIESGADVIALEELPEENADEYDAAMREAYPHSAREGTVGVWSRHELSDARPVDIGMGWTRALRATVATEDKTMAVYVAHLASVRVGSEGFASQQRDDTARALGTEITEEPEDAVLVLGDLNGTMQDRSLSPLASQLESTQAVAGSGFGFTWPASFPMARIDQILVRGMEPVNSWTLEQTESDHLPAAAELRF